MLVDMWTRPVMNSSHQLMECVCTVYHVFLSPALVVNILLSCLPTVRSYGRFYAKTEPSEGAWNVLSNC
jgi:hypothetical protein